VATTLLGLAACGGGGSSTAQSAQSNDSYATVRHLLATARVARVRELRTFSRCVRAHGVPGFPAPNSRGVLSPTRLLAIHRSGLARSENVALGACAHLLGHGQRAPMVGVRLSARDRRRYVACVRAHGLAGFAFVGSGAGAASLRRYLDAHRSSFERVSRACGRLLPRL
jgi:hypothetical protein